MKGSETDGNEKRPLPRPPKPTGRARVHDSSRFTQAVDSRNRRVPYLWIRNGRFYAQLWVVQNGRTTSRRFPLKATNLTAAKEELDDLRLRRKGNALPSPGIKPLLADYIATYIDSPLRQRRRANTRYKDRWALMRFLACAGNVRIDRITAQTIRAFTEERLREGVSARTVNLALISVRGLLKRAVEDGHILALPPIKSLPKGPTRKRDLITPEQFGRLLAAARACSKNGAQLADFLQFLAFSGCREQEALRLKWDDVDFAGRRLLVGRDGLSKNGEARTLEFSPQLEAHLRDMAGRRPPDCDWLFPSPQRGDRDIRAQTLRPSFKLARQSVGLPHLGFHDLRHYFASMCVMNGIDFMTTAAWLGHKDGGILVGKVYGHLLDEHRRQAAARVTFGIAPLPPPASPSKEVP